MEGYQIMAKFKSSPIVKSTQEIDGIRKACQITAHILDGVGEIVQPGINTEDINIWVHNRTLELGAQPATLGYRGFPKSVCTSPNSVVCHGIPSTEIRLNPGDILNIDVTSIYEGYFGDSSRMFFVGGKDACSEEAVALVEAAAEALQVGIAAVKPNVPFSVIGDTIEKYISHLKRNYGIVREYTGHGVGISFHEPPNIFHFRKNQPTPLMKKGMTFTIEPMINSGHYSTVVSNHDGWTVYTKDGSLSAQWEHTVLVTEHGAEILTLSPACAYPCGDT